jgi:hypothetical protein
VRRRSTARPCVDRSAFAGFRFPPEVITVAVRWYLLRYRLSYRDVEELLQLARRACLTPSGLRTVIIQQADSAQAGAHQFAHPVLARHTCCCTQHRLTKRPCGPMSTPLLLSIAVATVIAARGRGLWRTRSDLTLYFARPSRLIAGWCAVHRIHILTSLPANGAGRCERRRRLREPRGEVRAGTYLETDVSPWLGGSALDLIPAGQPGHGASASQRTLGWALGSSCW